MKKCTYHQFWENFETYFDLINAIRDYLQRARVPSVPAIRLADINTDIRDNSSIPVTANLFAEFSWRIGFIS